MPSSRRTPIIRASRSSRCTTSSASSHRQGVGMRHWILAASLGALLLIVRGSELAVDSIPFTEVNGGQIQVQGSVDGKPPVAMLIDLGAGVNVLSASYGGPLVFGPV